MAPVAYSGALPSKKKSELQEIAVALRLSDQGTKDELQLRIKRHLDANQDALEDDPAFAGLFGRRRRSVQPQPAPAVHNSGRFAPSSTNDPFAKPKSSSSRRALDPIEETPAKDMRNVSIFLKHSSPTEDSPAQSPRQLDPTTPSSLPPLPPSAPPSPAKSIIEHLPKPAEVKAAVAQFGQQQILQNGADLLVALRAFLSNSRNIWSVTSVFELLYILSATIPWKSLQIPINPKGDTTLALPYPPISVFQTPAFYHVLLQWAVPTLILPALLGCLISFNPAYAPAAPSPSPAPTPTPAAPLDPLTAAIVRLAAQTAYPYAALGARAGVVNLDVLGAQWRVLSAGVGLAFAFAEAIGSAPQGVARSLVREQRLRLLGVLDERERERTPVRRALRAAGEEDVE